MAFFSKPHEIMGKRNPRLATVFHEAASSIFIEIEGKSSEQIFDDRRMYKTIEKDYDLTLQGIQLNGPEECFESISIQIPFALRGLEKHAVEATGEDADGRRIYAWLRGINIYRTVIFGWSAAFVDSEARGLRMLSSMNNHHFQDKLFQEGFDDWKVIFWGLLEGKTSIKTTI